MGIAERKEREREMRRNAIVDAAERVFFANRIDTATMDQIAEEAELSKGTLYLYFGSKTDLLLAIQDRGTTILAGMLAQVFAENRKGLELIRRLGELYFDYARTHPNYFHAELYCRNQEFMEEVAGSEQFRKTRDRRLEIIRYVVKALQIGMVDGSIRPDINPHQVSLQLYAGLNGMVQMHELLTVDRYHKEMAEEKLFDLDLDTLVPNFIEMLLCGLRPLEPLPSKN